MILSTQRTAPRSPVVYGLGKLGVELMAPAFGAYFIFYYVDVLGLAVALAAAISTVYAIWDAFNDPLIGCLSDNTRTRWGRRRPWLLTGLPFYMVLLVLAYAVPASLREGRLLFFYALIVTFLFETASTVVGVNYEALFPELFRGFAERTRASSLMHSLGMIGELLGLAGTPLVYTRFGFVGMAVLYSALGGGLVLLGTLGNVEDPAAQAIPLASPLAAFREVLGDRPFWQVTAVATTTWIATGIYTMATPFYARYSLAADPQAPSYIFGTVFVAAIAAVPAWARLTRRSGVKRVWVFAIGVMTLSAVVFGLTRGLVAALVGAAVAGVGLGGVKVCREMTLASLVDVHMRRSGQRSEGLYYSLNRFIGRISRVLEALSLVLLGVLFGYVSGENPGPNPAQAFQFLMSVVPFCFLLVGFVIASRLPEATLEEARGGNV